MAEKKTARAAISGDALLADREFCQAIRDMRRAGISLGAAHLYVALTMLNGGIGESEGIANTWGSIVDFLNVNKPELLRIIHGVALEWRSRPEDTLAVSELHRELLDAGFAIDLGKGGAAPAMQ